MFSASSHGNIYRIFMVYGKKGNINNMQNMNTGRKDSKHWISYRGAKYRKYGGQYSIEDRHAKRHM